MRWTHTRCCHQSSVNCICIMSLYWAGSPSPWVTVGARKEFSSVFIWCILSESDRRCIHTTDNTLSDKFTQSFLLLYLYRHCLLPNMSKFDPLIYNLCLNMDLNLPLISAVKPSNTRTAALNISGHDLQELCVQMSESVGAHITLTASILLKSV